MALTGLVRAALPVVSLGMYNPENYGALGGATDDTLALQAAIDAAAAAGGGTVLLTQMHSITGVTLPSHVTLAGTGRGTGVYAATAPSVQTTLIKVAGSFSTVRDMDVLLRTDGAGSIGNIRMYGVWVETTAEHCCLDSLYIHGRYNDSVMGFTNGVRLTGNYNTMSNCTVLWCSMGTTARGSNLTVKGNHWQNFYTSTVGTVWSSSSPYWDGFAGEGLIDCLITDNVAVDNGQSGIYLGGGGSGYTSGVIVQGNRSYHNWNRGVDTGISGSQSTSNDVTNISILDNHIWDNRETQLWLYGTNNSRVVTNSIRETSEYSTLYGSQASSSRAGLALGQAAWCVNNVIDDNDIRVQSTTPFGVVLNGLGHYIAQTNRIGGGASNYWFGGPVNMLYGNKVEYFKASFTPVLRAGSSGVTLTSGSASYTVRTNEVEYDISLLMSSSGGSGNLYIGTLPATTGVLLDAQEVNISYWTGLTWALVPGSILHGYFLADDPAQIAIVRKYGSDTINDVPSCIGVGTRLRIKARAVVNTNTKVDTSPGISFFGHSFLSEQGLANGVAESLGKRCYNFERGGSSSKEAALVFGAIQNSYMPVGGVIPASGSVVLSPDEDAVWYAGASIATVTLAGVQGTITSTNVSGITNRLTFTRSAAGAAVSVPAPVPMVVLPYVRQNSWSTKRLTTHSTFKDDIVVIQCLRNNSSWGAGMDDIAAIVSALGHERFVILPEFPWASETTGTAGANTVSTYNALLKSTYPNNYCQIGEVDLLDNFKNYANPNYADDVTDVSNGVTPRSLRYDTLHPSHYRQANALAAGVQVNSEFIARFIKSKGW